MYPTIDIIFDLEKNEEMLSYKKLKKIYNYYFSEYIDKPRAESLGSFLVDFLNTDMHKEENIKNFITEYCFEYCYNILNPNKQSNNFLLISEKEYLKQINKIVKKFKQIFIDEYETFWQISIEKYRLQHIYENSKFTDPESAKYYKDKLSKLLPSDYLKEMADYDMDESHSNISIDFSFSHFSNIEISDRIPFAYKSGSFNSILYLSLRQIASSKYLICKCENCGKFFIPYTNHDTKYCDNIFKNNKTCKELAPEIAYKQKLKQDPLLKKYRSRYQSLQKSASLNPELNVQRYEDFKKIGAIKKNDYLNGKISSNDFEEWINSTKKRSTK